MKLLICFFMSDTEKYKDEAKNIFLEKCKDIYKKKINNLNEETVNNILIILDVIRGDEDIKEDTEKDENSNLKQIDEYTQYFMNYEEDLYSCQTSADDIKQISDLDKILDIGNEDPSEIEKLFEDLGPFIIGNKIFIESLIKNNNQNLNSNSNINIEECKKLLEENVNKDLSWDLDNIYQLFKKNIDKMEFQKYFR